MGRKSLELAEGESLASEGWKKGGISCVMQALKCSSRATKGDNAIAIAHQSFSEEGVVDSDWTDFGAPSADFAANAFHLTASSKKRGASNNEPQKIRHGKFDDVNNATTEIEQAVDHIPQTVTRNFSEDTHDTHETPPASNLNPNRAPADGVSPKENKLRLDAICSKYFNTPVGQPMHSTAPLGDSLSPVESPIEEADEEGEADEAISSEFSDAMALLQIPRMGTRLVRTESEVSSLLGEAIVEEKKSADDQLLLNPDNASVKIGYQEVKAVKSKVDVVAARTTMRPSRNAARRESWTSESSSYSSVSSFSALRSNTPLSFEENPRPLTPHAFFWRTYPNVKATPCSIQQSRSNKQRIPPRIEEEQVPGIPSMASTSGRFMGRPTRGLKFVAVEEVTSGAECAPFLLNPNAVRKLWIEKRPFRLDSNPHEKAEEQQPKNLQSTRPRQLVQSLASIRLPAVFDRGTDARQPEDVNLAMG